MPSWYWRTSRNISTGVAVREVAKYGTNEVWLSVIVTTLVTVAVFFLLTLVTGMTGILFKQIGMDRLYHGMYVNRNRNLLDPDVVFSIDENPRKDGFRQIQFYNFVSKMLDKLDSVYEKLIRWVLVHKTVNDLEHVRPILCLHVHG